MKETKKVILTLLGRFLFLSLLCYFSAFKAYAGDVQNEMLAPPADVFERMLIAAEKGEYEKINKALKLLEPLATQVNQVFSVDIKKELEKAIAAKERETTISVIQRFICLSIKTNLTNCFEGVADRYQITPRIRGAYSEYLVLDYYVRKKDFTASQVLKNLFRNANSMAGVKPQELKTVCQKIKSDLQQLFF